ncbi:DUF4127 family protein [Selenomonas sp. TAMA-11512]|uniref:DUF4127 family protein n=1 Tax=Selenomonas sp. TAMA-11512 TaxID=3095337 RepID=UPI0030CB4C9A
MICAAAAVLVGALGTGDAAAKAKEKKVEPPAKTILFIPHDNRPISDKQTAAVVRELGYEVIVPPDDMLGSRTDIGHPDALWEWVEANIGRAKAAVIASDSMLYGSLVGSRKHEETQEDILRRVARFRELKQKNLGTPLYVFGSIMRTPRSGEASGTEEPAYYRNYGADIFRYTALKDKQEMEGLNRREQKEYKFLEELIPQKSLDDWMSRRSKNFVANKALIDLTRKDVLSYFLLGRDDNAPYSQTHLESRKLQEYSAGLGASKYQSMAGIDESAMLLLTRAVNNMEHDVPFIHVKYNVGSGPKTIPAYSDETVDASVRAAIAAAGAMLVNAPEKADFLLAVNTNPNGKTYEANTPMNDGKKRDGTDSFLRIVEGFLAEGRPVGIADIAYANGSDNAMMDELKKRGLLFKLRAYSGWNTPTNSTGFVIGEGILANRMNDDSRDRLLLARYLDDWAYQANIRTSIARQLGWLRGSGAYSNIDDKMLGIVYRAERLMREFADENLPPFSSLHRIEVRFPWNRMFEADIILGDSDRHYDLLDTDKRFFIKKK